MPIGAINWNNATKTLILRGCGPVRGSSPYFSFRKGIGGGAGNDIFVDDSPIVDESTDPWGITHVNEIQVGSLTGSPANKKAQLIQWANQYMFMTIVLRSTLPIDEPTATVDPDTNRFYWSDEDGTKNPLGLWITSRSIELTDFDDTALGNDEFKVTVRRIV